LRRDGAQIGDLIYVSGTLGDAGAALQLKLQQWDDEVLTVQDRHYFYHRLEKPSPRIDVGLALLEFATSAIDISDGLSSDLGHILKKSRVGATIDLTKLPLSQSLQNISKTKAVELALNSGDDYELCFTIPADKQSLFESTVDGEYRQIGVIDAELGLRAISVDGQMDTITGSGYDHFSTNS